LLVRHGHYERVGDLGDEHWSLSALGRRQAARVGRRLSKVVAASTARLEGIFTSPWPRAAQTAEIAAREMEVDRVRVKPWLHETIAVVDPDRSPAGVYAGIPPATAEERELADAHVAKVRSRFFTRPSTSSLVIVFTHGNLIRYLVANTLDLPIDAWVSMDIHHCGITELRVYSSGLESLVAFNETGHLPPDLVTST
jgi:broad specificity phosphatase PhoE